MNPINKDSVKIEDGKLIITDENTIKNLVDQGMQFSDDGSLDLEDGQNIKVSIEVT